jgi:hypothetical protein
MTVINSLRLVATVSLFVAANCVIACECKVRPPFKVNSSQTIERYGVIMVGEIVSITPDNVRILPIEVFKGEIMKPLIFQNADTSMGCDYFGVFNARVGDRHLFFYGNNRPKTPQKTSYEISVSSHLTVCSYSSPIEKSADKLEILRKQFNKNTKFSSPKQGH